MATYAFTGGVDAVNGYGQREAFQFLGVWLAGETWTVTLVTTNGTYVIGKGAVCGASPTFGFKFKNRMYLAIGAQAVFSDNGDVTAWADHNPGAGTIDFLSQYGAQDTVISFAAVQGRLAVIGQNSVQFWTVDADPAQFALVQTLDNIGTKAKLSVQSLGEYDAIFLDSTGFRSLRSREVTLNAFIDDVGCPIDATVQAAMEGYDWSGACGIVDPVTKRYWCFLKDTIYVLSRFPSSKITAWSTYEPVDQNGEAFTPEKFVTYLGRVYCRDGAGKLLTYGGADGATYDTSRAIVEMPYLDHKQPSQYKQAQSVDVACTGTWDVKATMDFSTDDPGLIATLPSASFDTGRVPYTEYGTHVKLKFETTAAQRALLSAVIFKYQPGDVA